MRKEAVERVAREYISQRVASHDKISKIDMKELFLKFIASPMKYRRKLGLFEETLDDLTDEIIKSVAPTITEAIRESEVNADLDEFEEGAFLRYSERTNPSLSRGGYFPEYDPPKDKSEDFLEGYEWGDTNRPPPPSSYRKRLVEEATLEHEGKVTERVVVRLLKGFFNAINPWEILKHAFHLIKRDGWDVEIEEDIWYKKWSKRAQKLTLTALKVAFAEAFEHYILPQTVVYFTGDPSWWKLAAVPFLEIGLAISKFFSKTDTTDEDEISHLEWYEENFGDIDDYLEEVERNQRRASYAAPLVLEDDFYLD